MKPLGDAAYKLRDAYHYLVDGEVELLQELAHSLPLYPVVVNIGAGVGTSCLTFLEARRDINVVTVDNQAEEPAVDSGSSLRKEEAALREAGMWGQRHYQVQGDSKDIGKTWPDLVDMVFVDGDHSYEGCRGDIEAWGPHVRTGGVIAIHDYDALHRGDGTWYDPIVRAVDDTLSADPRWQEIGRATTTIAFRRL